MKRLFQLQAVLLFATFFAIGCKKDKTSKDDPFDPSLSISITNQAYANGARATLDLYLPANRGNDTRLLLMLHGGGWTSGDKADMTAVVQLIQGADPTLAIANINYTLVDGTAATRHPAQLTDLANALQYIRQNESTWHIGDHINIMGVSAGAHLALLYTLSTPNSNISSIIDVVGPTNFADPYYTNNALFQALATSYLGATWVQNAALHQAASPVNYVSATSPPTFMAYAGLDQLVPPTNGTALRDAYQQAGATYEYYTYPNEPHEISNTAILDILAKAVPFLQTYGR